MDSDSMRNFLLSSYGDFNYNDGISDPAAISSAANNGAQMLEQNAVSGDYSLLFGRHITQHQQEQDFASLEYGAAQMLDNSLGFANMQELMSTNRDFSGYGNMGIQRRIAEMYRNVPQTIADTPTSSQSNLSASSDHTFSLSGTNGASNASFIYNASPAQDNAYSLNAFCINSVTHDPYAEQGILGPWSQHSAGLLSKMVCTDPANTHGIVKRARRMKPKDKPKRPLSAYNIFFKEERARLLSKPPSQPGESGVQERNGNGNIGFERLAKIIGGKWRALKETDVEYYKEKAGSDMQRYKCEMDEYNKKMAEKATNVEEEEVDDFSRDSKRQRFE